MGSLRLKVLLLLSVALLTLSCGIKRPPKPLSPPEYEVRRIGSKVYLIPKTKDIVAEGFVSKNGFFLREDPNSFCFGVRSSQGKEVRSCVGEAKVERPSFEVRVGEEDVEVLLEEGTYRLYPYREGELVPEQQGEVRGGRVELRREFRERKVWITKVIGDVESEPALITVPPIQPPQPKPPEDLIYMVRGEKIYLYWWTGEENVRSLVYKNGKLLTQEPILRNYFVDDLPREETLYEIVLVNEMGGRSEPGKIIYRP